MRRIAAVIAVLVLAGCATNAPRPEEITAVPTDRLFAYQQPADGDATIVVTRDVGYVGSGCPMSVYIDGKEAARLRTHERATFHVLSGPRIVGTWISGGGLCGLNGKNRVEADATVRAGDTKRFRIGYNEANAITIMPTSY